MTLKYLAAISLAFSGSVGGAALATSAPTTGLGEPWPNTTDVSTNSGWHVYVFVKGATRYIQVNDASGAVRGAFARTPYSLVGLPIGRDAGNLATPDEPLPAPASRSSVLVYSGNGVQVFVAPQAGGAARLMAVSGECSGDPIECSKSGP